MGFQDSSWSIFVLRLVILAASVFEISCGKADRHTDKRRWKHYPPTAVGAGNKLCIH